MVSLQGKDSGTATMVTDTWEFFSVPFPTPPCWTGSHLQHSKLSFSVSFTLPFSFFLLSVFLACEDWLPDRCSIHIEKELFYVKVSLPCFMCRVEWVIMRSNCIIPFCFSIKLSCYFGSPQITRFIFPCFPSSVFSLWVSWCHYF